MAWVKIDDRMPEHPKMLQVRDSDALWLHVCALCYCNRNLTDGFVHDDIVARLSGSKRPRQAVSKLVAAGLWHEVSGGFVIHDYLEFQPSREDVTGEREKGKDRAARSYANRKSSGVLRPKNSEVFGDSSDVLRATQPQPVPVTSSSRDSSTASTGIPSTAAAAEALELYADIDLSTRSITDVRNPRSYRRSIVGNAAIEHGPAILALLAERPDATPLDILTGPLGVDPFTARSALAKREAS